jgi:Recombination endonuclease VII
MPYKDPAIKRAYMRNWRKRNPKRLRKYARKDWLLHKEARLAASKLWTKNPINLPKRRASWLRKKGWSESEINRANTAWSLFSGTCHGCGRTDCGRWETDHDHKTQLFRGILGGPCNRALGLLGDGPARLRALADYLERFQRWATQKL